MSRRAPPRAHGRPRRGERGAALLAALGALTLVGALAAAALPLATGPARRAGAALAQAEAARVAEAAIHRVVAALADPDERRRLPRDGAVIETAFLGARLRLSAQAAGGLVDLDAAPVAMLEGLLAATGAGPDAAARIAAALEAARAAARADGRRRAFAAPEAALAAVPPDDRPALAAALPFATVWSGRATVDRRTAPAPALAAATGAPLAAAQAHVAARALLGARAPPPPGDPGWLADDDGAGPVRVIATVETAAGGRAEATAVIDATPGPPPRWRLLAWR
jgi:type II secretory pathway component PulK